MNESDIAKLLGSVPLFTKIEHHDLELVAARMKEVHLEPGRVISKQGDWGVCFGEIGLIDGGVRSATVTAATDLTTLALVSWDFQPLLDNPAFSKGLLLGLCRLVRDYRDDAATNG